MADPNRERVMRCAECGAQFVTRSPNARYCEACRKPAWKRQQERKAREKEFNLDEDLQASIRAIEERQERTRRMTPRQRANANGVDLAKDMAKSCGTCYWHRHPWCVCGGYPTRKDETCRFWTDPQTVTHEVIDGHFVKVR